MSYIYNEFKNHVLDGSYNFPSGNSVVSNTDSFISGVSGSFGDLYRYPVLQEHEVTSEPIMWKCEGCDRVHKLDETLECECGMPITEKSRFVLLENE